MTQEPLQNAKNNSLNHLADSLVLATKDILNNATTEEDLRIGFEKLLEPIRSQLTLGYIPKYEKSVYTGRSDAVHGQLIIEYESPRSFTSKKTIKHAYEQLVDYLYAEADKTKSTQFVGVGFDGEQIFFVQYQDKSGREIDKVKFSLRGPYDFNPESAKTFLIHLRALCRLPLSAENLAQKFGPQGKVAPQMVSALVNALKHWGDKTHICTFFNEWKRLFGIVYGSQFSDGHKEAGSLLRLYKVAVETDFQELLFCIHTYFAILLKLIAAEILTLRETSFVSSIACALTHLSDDGLKKQLEDIENGGVYARKGISNFLEGDFFRWYLDALQSPELNEAIREVARELSLFEPATSTLEPTSTQDLLKKLYQYLVPQQVRHHLGEYYTPDWLAELLLNEVGYDGQTTQRLLDPACGSGTFVVLAIKQAIRHGREREKMPDLEIAKRIVSNIWGFDLNPLAVISARTNYLFALGDLINEILNRGGKVEIPIYLADAVLWPEHVGGQGELNFYGGDYVKIQTSIREFHVPAIWIKDKGFRMQEAVSMIEEFTKSGFEPEIAMEHFRKKGLAFAAHEKVVENFYKEVLELQKQRQNGIWARFLKKAFAPMIAGKFDYVVGNPPWIRWDYLSQQYRDATLRLWKDYRLFSLKGFQSRLGGGKKDFSMLFVYASSDYYLKDRGTLGFLITQEVFKSKGAGEGFRRFQLGDKTFLRVIKAHDFVSIQPFEGATNKTAAIVLRKCEKTKYPVPYYVWSKKKSVGKIPTNKSLDEALPLLQKKKKYYAKPIGSIVGAWQTQLAKEADLYAIEGQNYYKAVLGANPNPYGVFWLEIKQVLFSGDLIVRNLTEEGKLKIEQVEERIEQALVYPAIRGSDIEKWGVNPQIYMLVVQDPETRRGYQEDFMRINYPRIYTYLLKFKNILLSRALYKKYHKQVNAPFYSQFNISKETFACYKVVWKRMTNDLISAVISQFKTPFGFKALIPFETTAFIPTDNESEAHYLCAIINSKPVRDFIKSFSSAGRGFGTPSVMEHVGIPKFDPENPTHQELSQISQTCHQLKLEAKDEEIEKLQGQNDELVKELFSSLHLLG